MKKSIVMALLIFAAGGLCAQNSSAPRRGSPTLWQQALNRLPALTIAGRSLKFELAGDTWFASISGKDTLAGSLVFQETDSAVTVLLKQTHSNLPVVGWSRTPGPDIVLGYTKGPPASLKMLSRSDIPPELAAAEGGGAPAASAPAPAVTPAAAPPPVMTGGEPSTGSKGLAEMIERAARDIEAALPQRARTAVFDFTSPSERFSEYVIEELTSELVGGRKLTVIDRGGAAPAGETVQATGKRLGAQYIVSGALSNMGTHYRVRIRILNAETSAIQTQITLEMRNDAQTAYLMGGAVTGAPPLAAAGLADAAGLAASMGLPGAAGVAGAAGLASSALSGDISLLQDALNRIPAIPVAGKNLKFTFSGETWRAQVNGADVLVGTLTFQGADSGGILILKPTEAYLKGRKIPVPSTNILLEYNPPMSLRALSKKEQKAAGVGSLPPAAAMPLPVPIISADAGWSDSIVAQNASIQSKTTANLAFSRETIQDRDLDVMTCSVNLPSSTGWSVGVFFLYNQDIVEVLKAASGIRFKVLGDGKKGWFFALPINATEADGSHYEKPITTKAKTVVTVDIPFSSLKQPDWAKKQAFDKGTIYLLQFHRNKETSSGESTIKIFDFEIY